MEPVLITGCSSGIGRATALALAQRGLTVWATARRPESLDALADAGCRVLPLDVTDEQSRIAAVEAVEAEHGSVGTLVNNAGYAQGGPLEEVRLDDVRRQFETNVFGPLRMCQLVLPAMRAAGRGRIVTMGSAAGLIGTPGASAYGMTKWALENMADSLRYEVRRFGVDVVLMEPGGVLTNFAGTETSTWPATDGPYTAFRHNTHKQMERFFREGSRVVSKPEDVAALVVRAVTARRPRTRYKIGVAPRLMPLLYRLLPNRWWDRFMAGQFPMDQPPSGRLSTA
ncbi:SDR family NAD(P)-dependent oxidoreductase [Kutzneria buriramensis]|uniref:Short-subunit dehydrogenase n=1 Tax=Kutzneria buriramensis TaxID=1045776 RepID=A0A3E0HEL4_9PSEU|nr:SDR family NAD(P)-dependent oxidoreductase [Kutzneria buriramensis]REH43603.1 short-subunit dehydrogenase [Kutzneria buriramensis]